MELFPNGERSLQPLHAVRDTPHLVEHSDSRRWHTVVLVPMELRSVLIASGKQETRSMYADYFRWRDIEVREVRNAGEVLEAIATRRPHAIVYEAGLEDRDPLHWLRRLRASPQAFDLPIVLLSADVFRLNEDACRAAGGDAFVPIPCLPETLLEHLEAALVHRATILRTGVESWLYVRSAESVRIVYQQESDMGVFGPGARRQYFTFPSNVARVRFREQLEQQLAAEHFALVGRRAERRSALRPA